MNSRARQFPLCGMILAIAPAAQAANIKANIIIAPPPSGFAYHVGDQVAVSVRLRGETAPINSLELLQIDLNVTGGAYILDQNGDGQEDVSFAPFGPDGLAGTPATTLTATVPSYAGGGDLYLWLRTSTDPADLLGLPASDPGRGFVNFTIYLQFAGPVFVNALGPCIGTDGNQSGALDQLSGGIADPAFQYESCNPNAVGHWVLGVPGGPASGADAYSPGVMINVVPEPAALGMLFVGIALIARGRRI